MSYKPPIIIKEHYVTIQNSNGQIWYEGPINKKTRLPNGKGKRYYSNGDVFYGLFENGIPVEGCLVYNQGTESVEGKLKNGLFYGGCTRRGVAGYIRAVDMKNGVQANTEIKQYDMYVRLMQNNLIELSELYDCKIYVSPLNFLSQPQCQNRRTHIMYYFFRARSRCKDYEHFFPLTEGIVQYGKQNIIHIMDGQDQYLIMNRLKNYFIEWCKIYEEKSQHYKIPEFTLRTFKTENTSNNYLTICFELRNLVCKIVHQTESKGRISEMEAEIVNAVVYNRSTLELIDDKS